MIMQNHYFYRFGSTPVFFYEDTYSAPTPVLPDENASELVNPTKSFLRLLSEYMRNEEIIREHLSGEDFLREKLSLRNLGLTHIPPHFLLKCGHVTHLDLSGNDIAYLPVQLQCLPLVELNISGNQRLQPNIPDWLGTNQNLKLIANEIGLHFVPRGFEDDPDRVESDALPQYRFYCPTQS